MLLSFSRASLIHLSQLLEARSALALLFFLFLKLLLSLGFCLGIELDGTTCA